MEDHYEYSCPHCLQQCSVEYAFIGQNLLCPGCNGEFFATPPPKEVPILNETSTPQKVEKVPFFKFARKKVLKEKLQELISDGELSTEDDNEIKRAALQMGLTETDMERIQSDLFMSEFASLKRKMEKSFWCTNEDLEQIRVLEKKYGVHLTLEGDFQMMRAIYLMESEGKLPPPLSSVEINLGRSEPIYYSVNCQWLQPRVVNRGYSGTSISIPSGIKGVRFRFGGYTPIKCEEITVLSAGTLYITSKKILFHGDSRNVKIEYRKIIDAHIFTDALKIEKETGRPDYFSMSLPYSKYALSLITCLRQN